MKRAAALSVLFLVALAPAAGATGKGHTPVDICHKPGTPAEKTLTVDDDAVPGHLDHGDYLGACVPATTPEEGPSTTTTTTVPTTTTGPSSPDVSTTTTTVTQSSSTPPPPPQLSTSSTPEHSTPHLGCVTPEGHQYVTNIEQGGCPSSIATAQPAPSSAPVPATALTELPATGWGQTLLVFVGLWFLLGGLTALAFAQLIRGSK